MLEAFSFDKSANHIEQALADGAIFFWNKEVRKRLKKSKEI